MLLTFYYFLKVPLIAYISDIYLPLFLCCIREILTWRKLNYRNFIDWSPFEKQFPTQPFLEPDDDFRRAITGEELKRRMRTSISNFFASKR